MPLELPRYTVYLGDPDQPTEHTATVVGADQMLAEQAAPRYGITDLGSRPMTLTYLWCWAALKRTGDYADDWTSFQQSVLSVDEPETVAVDPTPRDHGTGSP